MDLQNRSSINAVAANFGILAKVLDELGKSSNDAKAVCDVINLKKI